MTQTDSTNGPFRFSAGGDSDNAVTSLRASLKAAGVHPSQLDPVQVAEYGGDVYPHKPWPEPPPPIICGRNCSCARHKAKEQTGGVIRRLFRSPLDNDGALG